MPWSLGLVASACFGLGFACGFWAAGTLERAGREDFKLYISAVVTAVWAISVAAGILIPDYQPSIALHAIMGAVAGYFFKTANPITGNDGKSGK